MQIYVVKQGDSLESIAAVFAVDVEEIAYANQLVSPYQLAIDRKSVV